MNRAQENIIDKADAISQDYYEIVRLLEGVERQNSTKVWLNTLGMLRVMYNDLREE
jgi:hypothetical protein